MRTAIAAAVFAAGALAVPAANRRQLPRRQDVVYDYEYVTVTDYVTVTEGALNAAVTTVATVATQQQQWQPNHWWSWYSSWQQTSAASPTPEASTQAPTSAPSSVVFTTVTQPASTQAPTTQPATSPSTTAAPATTAAPSTTDVASSTVAAPSPPAGTDYASIAVYHHNIHRANHSANPVTWDDGLASIAAEIASSCVYAHNVTAGGGGYGQNIAAGVPSNNISAVITDLFYNGEVGWFADLYGEPQPSMVNFEHWGHFSQIVWQSTTTIGCYTQDCSSNPNKLQNVGSDVPPYFTVCNYKSPGKF